VEELGGAYVYLLSDAASYTVSCRQWRVF
jgi:hypothetical protein